MLNSFNYWIYLTIATMLSGCGSSTDNNPMGGGLVGASVYTVGGTVTGLDAGEQLTLALNGNAAHTATVGSNTAFTFAQPVNANNTYAVTISAAPAGKTCSVANGAGAGVGANISNVSVTCATNGYQVSGTITGVGAQTTLLLNGDANHAVIASSDGSFSFPQLLAAGSSFTVSVGIQPTDLKYCQVSNATGTVTAAVHTVRVNCAYGTWVVTDFVKPTDAFPADPALDPVNASNGITRTFNSVDANLVDGYFDVNGNYYVISKNSPYLIFKVSNTGTKTSFLPPSSSGSLSSLTGDLNGNLYISDRTQIFKLSGNQLTTVCNFTRLGVLSISSLLFDASSNSLIFSDANSSGMTKTNTSCNLTVLNDTMGQANGLALSSIGKLLVSDRYDGILAVNSDGTTAVIDSAHSGQYPLRMIFDSSGNLLISTANSAGALAFDAQGNLILLASSVGVTTGVQTGVARSSNGDIYLTLAAQKKIIRLSRP